MRITRIIGIWAMLAGLLFWNGVLGFGIFNPLLGREAGEMMTAFIAMGIIFAAARPFLLEEPELSKSQAIRVSVLWVALTVLFEITLGRLAHHVSPLMTPEFGMWDGPFWPLIVLSAGTAPITWLRRSGLPLSRVTK